MERITSLDTQQQLQQLSDEWAAAEGGGDAAFFQRTLTDDFVGVGPLGFMLTKTDSVQRFTSGNLKYESFTWDNVKNWVLRCCSLAHCSLATMSRP